MTIILSNLNRFTKFFTGRFPGKFAGKCILKIPSHVAYAATLLCETLMSAIQAINDKLQCSVGTYLRCGRLVNNKIKKDLLLSLGVKKLKSVNIWKSYKQERDAIVRALRALGQRTAKRRSWMFNIYLTANLLRDWSMTELWSWVCGLAFLTGPPCTRILNVHTLPLQYIQ